jgi:hypothetical protein
MQGMLTLWGDPLTTFHAATKQYVDRLAAGSGGVYLPLTGGSLSGTLQLPNGSLAAPSLAIGDMDGSGIDRSGDALSIGVKGVLSASFFANSMQSYGMLYMLNNRITQVGDATGATDALNMRTGDMRYQPAGGGPFLPLTGGTLTGPLILQDMGSSTIGAIGLGDAAHGFARVGEEVLTVIASQNVGGWDANGLRLNYNLDMAGLKIVNLQAPQSNLDAANKAYVDGKTGTAVAVVTVADTPPTIGNGILWFDSVGARLYVGYNDGNSTQWVLV